MSQQSGFPRLLGDVGGTNARWAWQAAPGQPLSHISTLAAREHASIGECIAAYLKQQSLPAPRDVAFGIATAVMGDDPIPVVQEVDHLRVPIVAAQRPAMMEHDMRVALRDRRTCHDTAGLR